MPGLNDRVVGVLIDVTSLKLVKPVKVIDRMDAGQVGGNILDQLLGIFKRVAPALQAGLEKLFDQLWVVVDQLFAGKQ